MNTNRYLAAAIRGLVLDARNGHGTEYTWDALERIAAEVESLKSRDLIGQFHRTEQPA